MFGRIWIVLVLCFATVASAQSNPENLKEARAAYDQGDFARAKELTNRVLAQNSKDHAALYLRASARVELGVVEAMNAPDDQKRQTAIAEIRGGIEDARESLKIGGGGEINYYLPYLFGMIQLAKIEDKKEHANVALEVAKTVLARNITPEQRANVLYQRASTHLFLKDLKSAIEDYQAAVKAFPGHLGSYMGLAECYKFAGQPDKALASYTSAVEAMPTSALAYNNRGLFLQQQNKHQEAIADFNKAVDLDKSFSIAYANRGFSAQALGNLPSAEADFSQAISLDGKNPLFHSLRGSARLSQGNTRGAIDDYNDAIQILPQNPVAYADLGFAKYFSKDFAGASAAFEQATQVDANMMRYLSPWRVWSLVLAGKPDSVASIAGVSSSKAEKDRDWIDEQVLFLNGKDVSEKDLVDFISKNTKDPVLKNKQLCEAYYFIAERRLQADDRTNATAFYQQVIQTKESQLSAYRGAQFALQAFGK